MEDHSEYSFDSQRETILRHSETSPALDSSEIESNSALSTISRTSN